jgi:hypothetical protein
VQLISSIVDRELIIEPSLERTGFIKELTSLSNLFISAESISTTERLVNSLNASESTLNPNLPNMVVSGNTLAVRIPAYDTSNLGQVDNLGKYLRWCVTMLGLKNPEVKILPDSKLGNAILLPTKIERMMDTTIASMTISAEAGDRAEFKTGFKANLVELLAAVRLMRRYQGSLRKATAPKGHGSAQVTLEDLRKSINGRSGLNEHGLPPFIAILIKGIFSEMTKPNFTNFPGKWLNSLKNTNGTKSNIGIIYKLGYETSVPNSNKVTSVVMNTVTMKTPVEEPSKKGKEPRRDSKPKPELSVQTKQKVPDGISHRDFRLAAFLLLPLIDPKAKESLKDQIMTDPLSVKSKKVLGFYNRNRDVVDATNLAYATKAALGKKGSKATLLGYKSSRGHAIHLTANRVWMDKNGVEYSKLFDVPEHVRNFLLSHFNRRLSAEDSDSDEEEEYVEPDSGKESSVLKT